VERLPASGATPPELPAGHRVLQQRGRLPAVLLAAGLGRGCAGALGLAPSDLGLAHGRAPALRPPGLGLRRQRRRLARVYAIGVHRPTA